MNSGQAMSTPDGAQVAILDRMIADMLERNLCAGVTQLSDIIVRPPVQLSSRYTPERDKNAALPTPVQQVSSGVGDGNLPRRTPERDNTLKGTPESNRNAPATPIQQLFAGAFTHQNTLNHTPAKSPNAPDERPLSAHTSQSPSSASSASSEVSQNIVTTADGNFVQVPISKYFLLQNLVQKLSGDLNQTRDLERARWQAMHRLLLMLDHVHFTLQHEKMNWVSYSNNMTQINAKLHNEDALIRKSFAQVMEEINVCKPQISQLTEQLKASKASEERYRLRNCASCAQLRRDNAQLKADAERLTADAQRARDAQAFTADLNAKLSDRVEQMEMVSLNMKAARFSGNADDQCSLADSSLPELPEEEDAELDSRDEFLAWMTADFNGDDQHSGEKRTHTGENSHYYEKLGSSFGEDKRRQVRNPSENSSHTGERQSHTGERRNHTGEEPYSQPRSSTPTPSSSSQSVSTIFERFQVVTKRKKSKKQKKEGGVDVMGAGGSSERGIVNEERGDCENSGRSLDDNGRGMSGQEIGLRKTRNCAAIVKGDTEGESTARGVDITSGVFKQEHYPAIGQFLSAQNIAAHNQSFEYGAVRSRPNQSSNTSRSSSKANKISDDWPKKTATEGGAGGGVLSAQNIAAHNQSFENGTAFHSHRSNMSLDLSTEAIEKASKIGKMSNRGAAAAMEGVSGARASNPAGAVVSASWPSNVNKGSQEWSRRTVSEADAAVLGVGCGASTPPAVAARSTNEWLRKVVAGTALSSASTAKTTRKLSAVQIQTVLKTTELNNNWRHAGAVTGDGSDMTNGECLSAAWKRDSHRSEQQQPSFYNSNAHGRETLSAGWAPNQQHVIQQQAAAVDVRKPNAQSQEIISTGWAPNKQHLIQQQADIHKPNAQSRETGFASRQQHLEHLEQQNSSVSDTHHSSDARSREALRLAFICGSANPESISDEQKRPYLNALQQQQQHANSLSHHEQHPNFSEDAALGDNDADWIQGSNGQQNHPQPATTFNDAVVEASAYREPLLELASYLATASKSQSQKATQTEPNAVSNASRQSDFQQQPWYSSNFMGGEDSLAQKLSHNIPSADNAVLESSAHKEVLPKPGLPPAVDFSPNVQKGETVNSHGREALNEFHEQGHHHLPATTDRLSISQLCGFHDAAEPYGRKAFSSAENPHGRETSDESHLPATGDDRSSISQLDRIHGAAEPYGRKASFSSTSSSTNHGVDRFHEAGEDPYLREAAEDSYLRKASLSSTEYGSAHENDSFSTVISNENSNEVQNLSNNETTNRSTCNEEPFLRETRAQSLNEKKSIVGEERASERANDSSIDIFDTTCRNEELRVELVSSESSDFSPASENQHHQLLSTTSSIEEISSDCPSKRGNIDFTSSDSLEAETTTDSSERKTPEEESKSDNSQTELDESFTQGELKSSQMGSGAYERDVSEEKSYERKISSSAEDEFIESLEREVSEEKVLLSDLQLVEKAPISAVKATSEQNFGDIEAERRILDRLDASLQSENIRIVSQPRKRNLSYGSLDSKLDQLVLQFESENASESVKNLVDDNNECTRERNHLKSDSSEENSSGSIGAQCIPHEQLTLTKNLHRSTTFSSLNVLSNDQTTFPRVVLQKGDKMFDSTVGSSSQSLLSNDEIPFENDALQKEVKNTEIPFQNALQKGEKEAEIPFDNALQKEMKKTEIPFRNSLEKDQKETEIPFQNALQKEMKNTEIPFENAHQNALQKEIDLATIGSSTSSLQSSSSSLNILSNAAGDSSDLSEISSLSSYHVSLDTLTVGDKNQSTVSLRQVSLETHSVKNANESETPVNIRHFMSEGDGSKTAGLCTDQNDTKAKVCNFVSEAETTKSSEFRAADENENLEVTHFAAEAAESLRSAEAHSGENLRGKMITHRGELETSLSERSIASQLKAHTGEKLLRDDTAVNASEMKTHTDEKRREAQVPHSDWTRTTSAFDMADREESHERKTCFSESNILTHQAPELSCSALGAQMRETSNPVSSNACSNLRESSETSSPRSAMSHRRVPSESLRTGSESRMRETSVSSCSGLQTRTTSETHSSRSESADFEPLMRETSNSVPSNSMSHGRRTPERRSSHSESPLPAVEMPMGLGGEEGENELNVSFGDFDQSLEELDSYERESHSDQVEVSLQKRESRDQE